METIAVNLKIIVFDWLMRQKGESEINANEEEIETVLDLYFRRWYSIYNEMEVKQKWLLKVYLLNAFLHSYNYSLTSIIFVKSSNFYGIT